jgi:hypothetical protein
MLSRHRFLLGSVTQSGIVLLSIRALTFPHESEGSGSLIKVAEQMFTVTSICTFKMCAFFESFLWWFESTWSLITLFGDVGPHHMTVRCCEFNLKLSLVTELFGAFWLDSSWRGVPHHQVVEQVLLVTSISTLKWFQHSFEPPWLISRDEGVPSHECYVTSIFAFITLLSSVHSFMWGPWKYNHEMPRPSAEST